MEMMKAAAAAPPPQPDAASSSTEGDAAASPAASSGSRDPLEEFSRRLEDIISTYGPAASVLDRQRTMEDEMETMKTMTVAVDAGVSTDVSLVMQRLDRFSSPEDKLEDLLRTYAELAASLRLLQQRLPVLLEEVRCSGAARSDLEQLCSELQGHYITLREETLLRCRADEESKAEMVEDFQEKLLEIQTQIQKHSSRNEQLSIQNQNLSRKLGGLLDQCEQREENLEKFNSRRDLQQKLSEAKVQQANARLAEAEDKHRREKEYLLREAIDKTKKCFAMKEQELSMKKKLTLYAQKFDEFQETLAKSNQIYAHFKKEMEKMTEKMQKMDKESNVWRTRFENCNKALTDMIQERTEKSNEYDLFVLKIQRLEKLCRALQDERAVLYGKIKEVRLSSVPKPEDITEDEDESGLLKPAEAQNIQERDPVLTEDMTRLREEQAKLQEFAASLLATPPVDEDELDDEDAVRSLLTQFKEEDAPVPEQEDAPVPEQEDAPVPEQEDAPVPEQEDAPVPEQEDAPVPEQEDAPVPEQEDASVPEQEDAPLPEQEDAPVPKQEDTSVPEQEPVVLAEAASPAEVPVEGRKGRPVEPEEETQQKPPEARPELLIRQQEDQVQSEPQKEPESAPSSSPDSSKDQTPKRKKKRSLKNAS
ncbi:beta-taxilin isoform X1 [Brachionichthys hirsutus]|uniref:beta-taxilin isoform X1 n=1 Tax=Brachionichthys hirsutus TaxID=412623 RepID=UPI00360517C7